MNIKETIQDFLVIVAVAILTFAFRNKLPEAIGLALVAAIVCAILWMLAVLIPCVRYRIPIAAEANRNWVVTSLCLVVIIVVLAL